MGVPLQAHVLPAFRLGILDQGFRRLDFPLLLAGRTQDHPVLYRLIPCFPLEPAPHAGLDQPVPLPALPV